MSKENSIAVYGGVAHVVISAAEFANEVPVSDIVRDTSWDILADWSQVKCFMKVERYFPEMEKILDFSWMEALVQQSGITFSVYSLFHSSFFFHLLPGIAAKYCLVPPEQVL